MSRQANPAVIGGFIVGALMLSSNSQFEFLGRVEREVAVETVEHEGEKMGPTGKTQIARQRPEIIKEGLAAD